MPLVSIATFNANNFFLRYDFRRAFPGGEYDALARIDGSEKRLGYLPQLSYTRPGDEPFVVWDDTRRRLASQALREPIDLLPHVLCLQEVENIHALRVFNANYLDGHYTHALLIDGYDPRNIDVGILSRFPIVHARTHVDDRGPDGGRVFSRDCLEVTLRIPGASASGPSTGSSTEITLFLNHLKSKWVKREHGDTERDLAKKLEKANQARKAQAQAVREIVRRRFHANDDASLYAVIGDFNDTPQSPWLTPLTNSSARLWDVVRRHRADDDAWTHYWRGERRVSQVDYILGSRAFRDAVDAAALSNTDYTPHIERGGLGYSRYNAAGDDILPAEVKLFRSDDDSAPANVPFRFPRFDAVLEDWRNNISDHCPVRVWLRI